MNCIAGKFYFNIFNGTPQSMYRVPEFLAGRLNWLPQPPPPQASVSTHLESKWGGGHTFANGEGGGGEPIQTKGQTQGILQYCISLLSPSREGHKTVPASVHTTFDTIPTGWVSKIS